MRSDIITCPDCKTPKPPSDYYRDKNAPLGLSYYCKPCKRARTESYRDKDREHYNLTNRKAYHLRKNRKWTQSSSSH